MSETKTFTLKYGEGNVTLEVPQKNLLGTILPNTCPVIRGKEAEEAEVLRSLHEPIGTPALDKLLKPGQTVAIMVSDITRPAPSKLLLPPILKELRGIGIRNEDIGIFFGLGLHRRQTEQEQRYLVGDEIYENYNCLDVGNGDPVRSYGVTSYGTPIEIYKAVADKDFIIGTGNLDLHYAAGYAGGAKAVMPGAASARTIETHHRHMLHDMSESGVLEDNPFRMDMEEVADIVKLGFIVAAVMTEEKEIVRVVSGDFRKAHRAGCQEIDKMYKIPIEHTADIVVACASGFPKDINIYQSQKTIQNARNAVKKGGIIIMLAECREGPGDPVYLEWMRQASSLDDILERISKGFKMGGHKAAMIAKIMKHAPVWAVTSMTDEALSELMFIPKPSIQQALDEALAEKGKDATVWVMPYGALTLPCVQNL